MSSPIITNHSTFKTPRNYDRERREKAKAAGLCLICHKNSAQDGLTRCAQCKPRVQQYTRNVRDKRLSKGLCIDCGKAKPIDAMLQKPLYRLCQTCYFKRVAKDRLGTKKLWQAVRDKLVAQQYRCAYTGVELVLAVNASLDHIQPISKYPHLKQDSSNVEWVCKEVNEMKRDRSPDEFLDLIERIISHRRGLRLQASTWPTAACVA